MHSYRKAANAARSLSSNLKTPNEICNERMRCAALQMGFKMFLHTTATVTNWNPEGTECSLVRPSQNVANHYKTSL